MDRIAVTGLENGVNAIVATGTTLATADVRPTVASITAYLLTKRLPDFVIDFMNGDAATDGVWASKG